jgi:hypothetical protein
VGVARDILANCAGSVMVRGARSMRITFMALVSLTIELLNLRGH